MFPFTLYTNENKINIEAYSVYKISQGDIAGYSTTDLVYSDDLIAQPTDTVTNILDKIKKFFGDTYEYFYDIYGKFHFRKKIGYQQISYNPYDFYLDNNILVTLIGIVLSICILSFSKLIADIVLQLNDASNANIGGTYKDILKVKSSIPLILLISTNKQTHKLTVSTISLHAKKAY